MFGLEEISVLREPGLKGFHCMQLSTGILVIINYSLKLDRLYKSRKLYNKHSFFNSTKNAIGNFYIKKLLR